MKNIQIIDGARNSIFEIYSIQDDKFHRMFPDGASVAFMEDFPHKGPIWVDFYKNRVPKKTSLASTEPCICGERRKNRSFFGHGGRPMSNIGRTDRAGSKLMSLVQNQPIAVSQPDYWSSNE
jgi:hypothetical protein